MGATAVSASGSASSSAGGASVGGGTSNAIIGGEYEGFAKVITNSENQDTLGIHIVGPHATDLIAEASLAFELDATAWEIGGATHAHPTLSEVIGEAAMAVDGRSINF